ncbi:MAG: DNA-binding protein [Candidatus Bilamarchaeaceae archaeon]
MGDDEDTSARQQKMARMQAERKREEQAKQQLAQISSVLGKVLETPALDRMNNVKLVNPSLYMAASQQIVAIFQRLGRKLRDEDVVLVLKRLKMQTEKETSISYQRK